MNIIEFVRSTLSEFPKIAEVMGAVHVDFTDESPTNYGLSSTGDTLLFEDVLGNQTRQHNFVLYAVYQSVNDYDRLNNSGTLLELQYWLEKQAKEQEITAQISGRELKGKLISLVGSNGMIYEVPDASNEGVRYQLQIQAKYKIESEEF